MTTKPQDTPSAESSTQVSPGQLLRLAREIRGLSQDEVAARLNLRISLVRDIEQDRFDQRTASTFTRGYLKTYARLVGADENAVLAAYEKLGLSEVKYAEMHSFSDRTRLEANERRFRLFSWFCFIAVAVGVLYWILVVRPAEKPSVVKVDEQVLQQLPADQTSAAAGTEANANTPAVGDEQNAEPQAPSLLTDDNAQTSAAQSVEPTSAATQNAATEDEPLAKPPVSAAPATDAAKPSTASLPDAESAKGELVMQFSGDCWLQITDANGKTLISGVRKAGQTASLNGKAPFKLIVGAPKFVKLSYKGENVDMSRFPIGRVARFELPLKK